MRGDRGDRIEGYDVARAIAIALMILVNFQVFLLEPSGDPRAMIPRWLAHVPSGRSSSLFVTLAGIGVARMAGGDLGAARRSLFVRAAVLLVAGNLLRTVWSIDILHFYAFYLAIAAILLGARPAILASLAALVTVAGAAIAIAFPEEARAPHAPWSPAGLALDVLVDGIHPLFPWLAFVLVGMAIAHLDLRDAALRRRVLAIALAVSIGAEHVAIAAGALLVRAPLGLDALLGLAGTDWSPAPLYVVSASGSAIAIVALAHELVARAGGTLLVRALVSTGQLSLTIYLAHALVGVGVPRLVFGLGDALPIGAVVTWWLAFTALAIASATLWRRAFRRGPLEALLRRVAGSPAHPPPDPAPSDARPVPALAWIALAAGALLVLSADVVGVPPRPACPPIAVRGPAEIAGAISLACPATDVILELDAPTALSLSTRSASDLYLEARSDDPAAKAIEDDDSGPGLQPWIAQTLAAGRWSIRVRPYGASTGPFVLVIAPFAPR